ncbi:MAG: CRISPR-associated protein Cas4 [Thermoflexales bacterium]|nr:CRISPR-associated protein Cas4 [Thermoflexales bacterium]
MSLHLPDPLAIRYSPFATPMFRVFDLKQMGYCPRLAYYAYCLPNLTIARPPLVSLGARSGQAAEALEHRRSLRAYGLREGKRYFQVWLESESLDLCGQLDLLIETPDELIPVDFKDSLEHSPGRRVPPTVYRGWAIQLAAYALLLEQTWDRPVRRGFIYYIPTRRARQVEITDALRDEVRAVLAQMRAIVEREVMPPPTPYRARCRDCEFRRFCNDV